jgi:hypothetical protein
MSDDSIRRRLLALEENRKEVQVREENFGLFVYCGVIKYGEWREVIKDVGDDIFSTIYYEDEGSKKGNRGKEMSYAISKVAKFCT